MAIEYIDGAEYISGSQCNVGPGGMTNAGGGGPTITTGAARSGLYYFSMSNNTYMWKSLLTTPLATRWIGMGIFTGTGTPVGRPFVAFTDDGGVNPNEDAALTQISFALNATRHIEVYRGRAVGVGSGGTLLGTSSQPVNHSQWWWLDLGVTIHGSTGVVEIWIDDVQILNLTSQNTQNTGAAQTTGVIWRASTGDPCGYNFDDLHISTTRIGPHKIIGRKGATGNGSNTDFDPISGSDRGAMVDDLTPDDDSTYNFSANVGDRVTHNFDALEVFGTVSAVKVRGWIRKSDVGPREWAPVLRIGGVNYDGDGQVLSTSYGAYSQMYDANDPALNPWTIATIDAMEGGSKVEA